MQIRRYTKQWRTDDYICDVCKEKSPKNNTHELSSIYPHHPIQHECHLCPDCTVKVFDFIETLGGKVREISDDYHEDEYACDGMGFKFKDVDYVIEDSEHSGTSNAVFGD